MQVTTVAVTTTLPPLLVVMVMSLEPVAELFGVTVNVVEPVAAGPTVIVFGAKVNGQLAAPLPGTFALKVKARGRQPAGSLFRRLMVNA